MVRSLYKLLEVKEKDNFGVSDAIRNLIKDALEIPEGLLRNTLTKSYDAKSFWIRCPEEIFSKLCALSDKAHIKKSMVINWLVFNSLRDELTPEEAAEVFQKLTAPLKKKKR